MQKKIYVSGLFDDETVAKINEAVGAISGVTNCAANASKAQVLVDFDESVSGIEEAINSAVSSTGVEILGI